MKNLSLLSALLLSNLTMFSVAPTHAQEKACVRTDLGKKVCGILIKDNGTESSPAPTSVSSIDLTSADEKETINIRLQKCTKKASTVSCRFSAVITEDKNSMAYVTLYAARAANTSLLIDSKEEEYKASEISIGTQTAPDYISIERLKNQPFSFIISFKAYPSIKTIEELRIPMHFIDTQIKLAKFSDIKIQ